MNDAAQKTDHLIRSIINDPPEPTPLPRAVFSSLDGGRLDELATAIRKPIEVPQIGEAAAHAMHKCFETVGRDVLKVAQEQVDRAQRQLDEAKVLVDSLLATGVILCDRIKSEAVRGIKVSEVMRIAAQVIGEPTPLDHTEKPDGGRAAETA